MQIRTSGGSELRTEHVVTRAVREEWGVRSSTALRVPQGRHGASGRGGMAAVPSPRAVGSRRGPSYTKNVFSTELDIPSSTQNSLVADGTGAVWSCPGLSDNDTQTVEGKTDGESMPGKHYFQTTDIKPSHR